MIRHANLCAPQTVGSLTVAVIEATFLGLLMAAISNPMLQAAGELAAGVATIDLSPFALRTDEKDHAATRPAAKALPE